MRKHNEGYALPFVLVVSVVMCLIAVTVMSFSLKNLQVQQASVQRTQAKYDAAGKIEEIVAATKTADSVVFDFNEDDLIIVPNTEGKTVQISAKGVSQNGETEIWLNAEIELKDITNGNFASTYFSENADGTLTVSYKGDISFISYSYSETSKGEETT